MIKIEKQLLGNVLDALDRLFDRESSVLDVWALVFATAAALRETPHHDELSKPIQQLLSIARSKYTSETQRDHALNATDDLRKYLATVLPFPN